MVAVKKLTKKSKRAVVPGYVFPAQKGGPPMKRKKVK